MCIMQPEIIDFGLSRYKDIRECQKSYRKKVIESKTSDTSGPLPEYLMIGEHYPVYTLGFHGEAGNILVSEEFLGKKGCEVIRIERGGDITYHGPGQVILYPIIDLQAHGLGVKQYVSILEETIIQVLEEYGVKGERIEGATGVWIGKATNDERKICAIGIKVSRGVTMHGLALNVNTDLSYFSYINPCGFKEKGVTSLSMELGQHMDIEELKRKIIDKFLTLLPYRENK